MVSWQASVTGIPAIAADGTIIVSGDQLVALHPDGSIAWSVVGQGATPPAIGPDGVIHTGAAAFDASGGPLWTSPCHSVAGPSIGPDGTIVLFCDGESVLEALHPDGSIAWSEPMIAAKGAGVAIDDQGVPYVAEATAVGALSLATGQPTWTCGLSAALTGSVALPIDGSAVVGGAGLFRVQSGILDWQVAVGPNSTTTFGAPVLDVEGFAYTLGSDGTLTAVTTQGATSWTFVLPAASGLFPSPVIGPDGTLYVASSTMLYALSP
jgi:hypothetical protein